VVFLKALLFHCKHYLTEFDSFSNRPSKIRPEELKEERQECNDCVVALVTVEKKDELVIVTRGLADEIAKMCKEVGKDKVVIVPFAHLSSKLAGSEKGVETLKLVEKKLEKNLNVERAHFGSNKSLLLDVFGHAGNVRFREF